MRSRPASRLLLLDRDERVLLFRFSFAHGPLAGRNFWATPGGEVEDGETFEQAAIRELEEETGLTTRDIGEQIARREFELKIATGEHVMADERYFVVRTSARTISDAWQTAHEREVMIEHHWWSVDELMRTPETVYPEDLPDLIRTALRV